MNPQEQHEYDLAVQHGHKLFLDNYPIDSQHVLDLLNAVKKKRPELVVASVSRQMRIGSKTSTRGELYTVYRGLDMAYANLPEQVVGTIGYEYDQFFVTSRLIENAKYSQWSGRDYNTKKSKHMNNIVKEAPKYLLPTQFKEVVDESNDKFNAEIRNIRDKAIHDMRGVLNRTTGELRDELFHMVKSGYKPKNASFASAMAYVIESKEDFERNQHYDPPKAFVWIKPDSVLYKIGKEALDSSATSVATTNDLPEEIRGKLFVLMVADKNKFVDDVGMKADDNKFWVIL
jgi:hypothetical protein